MHQCNNRKCVNPMHLKVGTQKENMMQKQIDHTQIQGSKHKLSKLTEGQVKTIKKSYANGKRICDIARKYGVSAAAIDAIVKGRTWKHVKI